MKFSLKNLLQNKIVLYVVLFFSITSMFSYLMAQNYLPVLFFVTIAFLTNYFSKNMIVVLGLAVLSTNMLTSTTNILSRKGFREGLEGNDDGDDNGDDNEDVDEGSESKSDKTNLIKNIERELHDAEKKTKQLGKDDHKKNNKCGHFKNRSECKSADNCEWDKDNSKCRDRLIKSNFQNLNPASYPSADKSKPNLDEAGTVEAAYDNLENLMGSDSIRSMTMDTQKLVDRQKELIDQLKNVAPLISQTTKMISSFNMDGKLQGMIDGLTKNISSLNTSDPEGVRDPTN
jgi:hypothetical protein